MKITQVILDLPDNAHEALTKFADAQTGGSVQDAIQKIVWLAVDREGYFAAKGEDDVCSLQGT